MSTLLSSQSTPLSNSPSMSGPEEELVQFTVGKGTPLPLYGILHHPISEKTLGTPAGEMVNATTDPSSQSAIGNPTGVVLLGGWSGTRVGPHGILVSMARELARAGFYALRFDFRGRGDSGGAQSAAHIGSMVEDAQQAAAFLRQKTGVRQVILLGICAGAQVAMGAAPAIQDLSGLVLWSPPPFHPDDTPTTRDGDTGSKGENINRSMGQSANEPVPQSITPNPQSSSRHRNRRVVGLLKQYWAKLFDPRTWAKLTHGELQFKTILRVLTGKSGRTTAPTGEDGLPLQDGDWAGPKPDEAAYEQAFTHLNVPALFIFGGSDPEREESSAYYSQLRKPFAHCTSQHVVPGANHAFYSLEWKEEVIQESLKWIKQSG